MRLDRRTLFAATLTAAAGASCARAQTSEQAPVEPLQRPARGHIRVAFLINRFHNIMDLAGPWEAFASAGSEAQRCELYTVSPTADELSLGGVRARSDYVFANAPQPHVIVMGAQNAPDDGQAKLAWIRQAGAQADIVMSVCTGAFVLAASGLIDGRTATTHHDYYDAFARSFPNVELVRGRRFVDNGKFVSAGGLTSGVDGALHVIALYWNADEAQRVADYMEHYSDGWRTGVRTPA